MSDVARKGGETHDEKVLVTLRGSRREALELPLPCFLRDVDVLCLFHSS